jgi:hypothetical protein
VAGWAVEVRTLVAAAVLFAGVLAMQPAPVVWAAPVQVHRQHRPFLDEGGMWSSDAGLNTSRVDWIEGDK